MSDNNETNIGLELKKAKIIEQKQRFAKEKTEFSWNAVAKKETELPTSPVVNKTETTRPTPSAIASSFLNTLTPKTPENLNFQGKNLQNGSFAGESLENANFAGADLTGINLANANLRGVDFSGADLTGANLEGADLTGANFSGAKLTKANLQKAKLRNVDLNGVDLTDAVFLEIDIDNLTLEDLQELVEFLAIYYPHKLNLARFDLKLLDLSRIDLSNVNLRGVDFTGVNFTGINIFELDLSECIITPEQIAQALGRVPSPEELKKILAPKPKKKAKNFFIDMTDFFFDNGIPAGVWDTRRGKGTSFDEIFSAIKRFTNAFKKDEKVASKPQEKEPKEKEASSNDDLRRAIEENKKQALEEKIKVASSVSQSDTPRKPQQIQQKPSHQIDPLLMRHRGDNSRGV